MIASRFLRNGIFVLVTVSLLTACGKKAGNRLPESEESTFPRTYPAPATVVPPSETSQSGISPFPKSRIRKTY